MSKTGIGAALTLFVGVLAAWPQASKAVDSVQAVLNAGDEVKELSRKTEDLIAEQRERQITDNAERAAMRRELEQTQKTLDRILEAVLTRE